MIDSTVKPLNFGKIEDSNFNMIYCNGILSDYDDEKVQRPRLEEQIGVISTAFENRKFTVFNNPTNLDEYFSIGQDREEKEELIAKQFAIFIRKNIDTLNHKNLENLDKSPLCITLLAHSHGALITKMALKFLTLEECKNLKVIWWSHHDSKEFSLCCRKLCL